MKYLKRLILTSAVLMTALQAASAFNLITDIEQNTQWTLGSEVQGGTAIAMRSAQAYNIQAGQFVGSALASVASYRFLNLAGGGTSVTQPDGSTKLLDTGKIGFNMGYLLRNFTNQPPALIKNLVFGPSLSTTLVTTPHVFVPFFDLNYKFSGGQ